MNDISEEDLDNRFRYYPPKTEEVRQLHSEVRDQCWALARFLREILPASREKLTAITKLEETMYWSNAALARNNEG